MFNYGNLHRYKKMCNTSRDIIRYFSTVASEDTVQILYILIIYKNDTTNSMWNFLQRCFAIEKHFLSAIMYIFNALFLMAISQIFV